jgi:hypothetical protein
VDVVDELYSACCTWMPADPADILTTPTGRQPHLPSVPNNHNRHSRMVCGQAADSVDTCAGILAKLSQVCRPAAAFHQGQGGLQMTHCRTELYMSLRFTTIYNARNSSSIVSSYCFPKQAAPVTAHCPNTHPATWTQQLTAELSSCQNCGRSTTYHNSVTMTNKQARVRSRATALPLLLPGNSPKTISLLRCFSCQPSAAPHQALGAVAQTSTPLNTTARHS